MTDENRDEGDRRDELQEGAWAYRHPNGKRQRQVTFRKGQADGWETFWDAEGKVLEKRLWEDGKLEGK